MKHEDLITQLQTALEASEHVKVTFRTKLGKVRIMHCSRALQYIPEKEHSGREDFKINHSSIIGVWDFQNQAWRSFRKDAVISFEVSDVPYDQGI